MDRVEMAVYGDKLLGELSHHVGRHKAIGMGELYEKVFGETWQHRINDTRRLRIVIEALRDRGDAICSASSRVGGGYYLPSVGSELKDYCSRRRRKNLKGLMQEARMLKISLPELLGQIELNLAASSPEPEGRGGGQNEKP